MSPAEARSRLDTHAARWNVTVRRTVTTQSSLIAFGNRLDEPVVLKIARRGSDEWNAGRVAAALRGEGMVRVLEHTGGAVLLEELRPGTPLTTTLSPGCDDHALDVLAGIALTLAVSPAPAGGYATAEDWGAAFGAYISSGDLQIPAGMVRQARQLYLELCRTQTGVRLLHGDLQHYNVLRDARRGWVSIDPKGVIAETEFEFGAALRNPPGMPDLYERSAIERRTSRLSDVGTAHIDRDRVIAWTFAQAVLSAIWTVQDAGQLERDDPALAVASALQSVAG